MKAQQSWLDRIANTRIYRLVDSCVDKFIEKYFSKAIESHVNKKKG